MSIKIENTQVFGWEAAIRGARNPMNSWEKSDTFWLDVDNGDYQTIEGNQGPFYHFNDEDMMKEYNVDDFLLSGMYIGPNDHKLLMNLCKGGTEESKWRRMVHVQMDVTAPSFWWPEFDAYKVGVTRNSCSKMHKLLSREFTTDDFGYEDGDPYGVSVATTFNYARNEYLKEEDPIKKKWIWYQILRDLPMCYMQKATIDLNYEVLAAQYRQRKDHKLTEWLDYCNWTKSLPYSEFITMEK